MADEGTTPRAQIIELDDIVPRSTVFRLHGEEWILPGDIDVETTFRIQRLLLDLADAEQAAMDAQLAVLSADDDGEARDVAAKKQRAAFDEQGRVTAEMEDEILGLFRVHHPDLERLPFGAAAFRAVLAHVLVQLGFGEEDEEANPPKPPETMKPVRSRRSSTSTGSRRSSASTPTTGSAEVE